MGDDDGVEVGAPGACLVGEAVVLGVKSESVGDDDGVSIEGTTLGIMLLVGLFDGFPLSAK